MDFFYKETLLSSKEPEIALINHHQILLKATMIIFLICELPIPIPMGKRIFDIIFSVFFLLVSTPIIFLIVLLYKLEGLLINLVLALFLSFFFFFYWGISQGKKK